MARRLETHHQADNRDRWMVSYADFITLLFAFFVVMYSISSVNEGKYRVLSDSLDSAFGSSRQVAESLQIGLLEIAAQEPGESSEDPLIPLILRDLEQDPTVAPTAESELESKDKSFSQQILDRAESEVNSIATDVEGEMEELIDDDIINIKRNKFWLEVEIKSSLLFSSGSSALLPNSVPALENLAGIFAGLPNRIHVEGFTDNKPINNEVFPSNWELSAARAAAVVRLFERNGIEPARMASIGYGEYHPISDNDTEEGRAKNRRVVMVVMASMEGRDASDRIYEFDLIKERTANLENN